VRRHFFWRHISGKRAVWAGDDHDITPWDRPETCFCAPFGDNNQPYITGFHGRAQAAKPRKTNRPEKIYIFGGKFLDFFIFAMFQISSDSDLLAKRIMWLSSLLFCIVGV
jgi:hypothetical protein